MLTASMKKTLLRLRKTGRWMVRISNDGVSYNRFKWKPVGEWTEAPDFNTKPECGGGLHGQSRKGWGYCNSGTTFEFCETSAQIALGDKVKVQKAKRLLINEDAFEALEFVCPDFGGSLDIRKGASLTAPKLSSIGGYLDIHEGASLTAPKLSKCGYLNIRKGASLTAPKLSKCGYLDIHEGASLTAPLLKR